MTATITQARDDMNKIVVDAWVAAGRDAANVRYDDINPVKPANTTAWIRITVKHETANQASLQGEGRRRYERRGTLWVQLFTEIGKGLSESDVLTKVLQDALEGKYTPNGVWFRRVRVNEIGPGDGQYHVNVLADFVYDEVK